MIFWYTLHARNLVIWGQHFDVKPCVESLEDTFQQFHKDSEFYFHDEYFSWSAYLPLAKDDKVALKNWFSELREQSEGKWETVYETEFRQEYWTRQNLGPGD